MKLLLVLLFGLLCLNGNGYCAPESTEQKPLVLLHGLARTAKSMEKIEKHASAAGFTTCNISYPSTKHDVTSLTTRFVLPQINECFHSNERAINFITHSLGGIIVRQLATLNKIQIGRVVMLSPPNQGSEVVDKLGDTWLFRFINGPAGLELGTEQHSIPNQLGNTPFETGIIAGNSTINFILSMLIPGEDDGKVSVEKTKVEDMKDFLVIPATHPFIVKNDTAIRQALFFLNNGYFLD